MRNPLFHRSTQYHISGGQMERLLRKEGGGGGLVRNPLFHQSIEYHIDLHCGKIESLLRKEAGLSA